MKNQLTTSPAPGKQSAPESTLPRFARNQEEFMSALFTGPQAFDGYVIRKLKSGSIRLFFRGKYYTLNKGGVFCLESQDEKGRTVYSYGGALNEFKLSELDQIEGAIREMEMARP